MKSDNLRWRLPSRILACLDLILGMASLSLVIWLGWKFALIYQEILTPPPNPENPSPEEMNIHRLKVLGWILVSTYVLLKSVFWVISLLIFALLTCVILWDSILLLKATKKNGSKDSNPLEYFENRSMAMEKAESWQSDNFHFIGFAVAGIWMTYDPQANVLLVLELCFVFWRAFYLFVVTKFIWELENSIVPPGIRKAK